MIKIKLGILLLISNLYCNNFYESKKILLDNVYFDNQKTFYCNNAYEVSKNGFKKNVHIIEDIEKYSAKNPNNERSTKLEWEHVVPAYNFGRQLFCWKKLVKKIQYLVK